MTKTFEEIDHTADIALQVWGNNLEELFSNAAQGMYSLIHTSLDITGLDDWDFSASDQCSENLLVEFLNELNYCICIKKTLICMPIELNIMQNPDMYTLKVKARSQHIPDNIFNELLEIKAVTYHDLDIKTDGDMLTAKIIFDI